ncbi:hypothetical protein Taro_043008 [Colocasia esculenta]|uniref:Secreted protein n=1 Tax=Colocasia esculenta TaxID=4460 RepID=A0A843X3H3_COLES|nr:hypothetical protein [Colocasia esculenta]
MQTLLSSSFFSFLLPSFPLRGGGAPSLFLRCWAWGGVSVLVAERWSDVDLGDHEITTGWLSRYQSEGDVYPVLLGFREGCRACLCLLVCLGYKPAVLFACCGCLACSQFRSVLGTQGLVRCRGFIITWTPSPRAYLREFSERQDSVAGEQGSGRCVILLAASGGGLVALAPSCCFHNLFLGAVRGSTGGRACGETSFSRGCSVSLVVTPVYAFLTSWRCVPRVDSASCLTLLFLRESRLARPWLQVVALLCSAAL